MYKLLVDLRSIDSAMTPMESDLATVKKCVMTLWNEKQPEIPQFH